MIMEKPVVGRSAIERFTEPFRLKWAGVCDTCGDLMEAGTAAVYLMGGRTVGERWLVCSRCHDGAVWLPAQRRYRFPNEYGGGDAK